MLITLQSYLKLYHVNEKDYTFFIIGSIFVFCL